MGAVFASPLLSELTDRQCFVRDFFSLRKLCASDWSVGLTVATTKHVLPWVVVLWFFLHSPARCRLQCAPSGGMEKDRCPHCGYHKVLRNSHDERETAAMWLCGHWQLHTNSCAPLNRQGFFWQGPTSSWICFLRWANYIADTQVHRFFFLCRLSAT